MEFLSSRIMVLDLALLNSSNVWNVLFFIILSHLKIFISLREHRFQRPVLWCLIRGTLQFCKSFTLTLEINWYLFLGMAYFFHGFLCTPTAYFVPTHLILNLSHMIAVINFVMKFICIPLPSNFHFSSD